MKIGLEFEGVIRDRTTGEIARWSKMPDQIKRRIKTAMFPRKEALDPCDRYDALAEVRTDPLENPSPKELIWSLFEEMERASIAFNNNGYDIQWWEQELPKALHEEIKADFATDDPEGKKSKSTITLKENGERCEYKSEGNLFRGGGLHINISHVPFLFCEGLMLHLHNGLKYLKTEYKFQSHYRTNFLYRNRYDDSVKITEPQICIAEYMSHGFNVPTLSGWRERWMNSEKAERQGSRNMGCGTCYGFDMDMRWAFELLRLATQYFNPPSEMK